MLETRASVRLLIALALLAVPVASAWALPPAGFVNQSVVAGLNAPTDLAFLPDGRLIVTTKPGQILILNLTANPVVALPYMTVPNVHSAYAESGIMSIVLDPGFATNNFFYVYYAHAPTMRYRISRFTHAGNQGTVASEVVIWSDDANFASCCHWGGGLDFGPDGKLYLTTGDKTSSSAPQSLTVAGGKVLRLNADGTIPADNPFFDGAGPNLDAIWARGLRNPFRAHFDPPTGRFFITENGDHGAEDVHLGRPGANYGWPQCEGMCTNPAFDDPIFTYPTQPTASVTAGLVYRGSLFGPAYGGLYFFADYMRKWIRTLTFDVSGTVPTAESEFEPAAGDVVAFKVGPDGALYYLNHSGAVRRITLGSPAPAGTITFDAASLVTAKACTASTTLVIPSVVVGQQTNRILIAAVGTEQLNSACDMASTSVTATYGGQLMTKATTIKAARNDGKACTGIFYLLNPPAGAANVVVTWPSSAGSSSESVQRFGAAYVIHGAAQAPPEATAGHATQTEATQPSIDVATFTPGAFVADIALVGNNGTFAPQAPGQSELFDLACDGSAAAGAIIDASTPGIAVSQWQHPNPNRFSQSIAAFAPAPVSAPGTTTTTTLPPTEPIELDPASVKTACGATAADTLVIPSVAVSAKPNRVLVVTVGAEENDPDCDLTHPTAAVAYGGIAMTRAVAARSDTSTWRTCNGVFYLLDPPVGTANVTIAFPKTSATNLIDNRQAGAFLLYNVALEPPEMVKAAGAETTAVSITNTIQTLTDGAWVVDVFTQGNLGTLTTTQAGQIERWDIPCGGASSGTSTKEVATAAVTAVGWSRTSPHRYAQALAVFAPAAAPIGTTTTIPTTTMTTTTTTTTTTTLPAPPATAIAFDAASLRSACGSAAADTLVIASVPVTARPNRTLIVTVGAKEDDGDCDLAHPAAAVTYGGVPMTRAVAARSDTSTWRACNAVFYLHNAPVGTANVTIQFPSTTAANLIDNRQAAAFLLYNVAQLAPQAIKTAGEDRITNPVNTSITTLSNGAWVVDVFSQGAVGTFTTTQAGQIERSEQSCGGASNATSTKEVTSAGATSLGWSHSAPKRYAHALAAFARAN